MKRKKQKGFTLAEILVIIIVIAVLAAIAMPIYTKAVMRSRASDALKVLSLASAKQEVFLINNDRFAASFNELAAPVKGLVGMGQVPLGHFTYAMDQACILAARPGDQITLFRNFETQQTGCMGDGCPSIEGLVPQGDAGCALNFEGGNGEGNAGQGDVPITGGGEEPGEIDCRNQPACPPGFHRNMETCKCECSQVVTACDKGSWNPQTCQCETSGCIPGTTVNKKACSEICVEMGWYNCESCDGTATQQCYENCTGPGLCQTWNTSGCVCLAQACVANKECAPGYHWDTDICDCKVNCPHPFPCPSGKTWSTTQCKCVCEFIPSSCPSGKTWNSETCACEQTPCNHPFPCPSGKTWSTTQCKCVCSFMISCPTGKTWNSETCACECDPQTVVVCAPGYTWNTTTCQCVKTGIVITNPETER